MNLLPTAPDWTQHLQADERVLWSGQPEAEGLLLGLVLIGFFTLFIGPMALLLMVVFLVPTLLYARDAYALTNSRILAYRHLFGGRARVESLPRAGTYAGPQMGKGPRAVVFTAPDRTRITFQFQSRATQRMLIDSYPKGGPFPNKGTAA